MYHRCTAYDLIIHVDDNLSVALRGQFIHHVAQVGAVQLAGLAGQPARQIGVADYADAVHFDYLTRVTRLNLALFALWRHRGIVDPAFYGVPAGLTLMAAAEVVRREAGAAGRLGLHHGFYADAGIAENGRYLGKHAWTIFGKHA